MPKGSVTPRDRAVQRYTNLTKQLKKLPTDYSRITQFRRRVKDFFGTSDGQLVTSSKRMTLLKRLEKMEKNMGIQGNMQSQKNIEEEQNR